MPMTHRCARCCGPLCLPPVAAEGGDPLGRVAPGDPVVCLNSGERGSIVSADEHRGEALVAFAGSTVLCALADLARPGRSPGAPPEQAA